MRAFPAIALLFAVLWSALGWGADGLVVGKSPFGVKETMDRLETIVKTKGMTVFVRIDHAAGAAKVGKNLRPTELLLFGNPKGGTPFMECTQTVGIDLPMKMLAWEDQTGQVWLGYNDPAFLAARHGIPQCPMVGNMSKALAALAHDVTAQ